MAKHILLAAPTGLPNTTMQLFNDADTPVGSAIAMPEDPNCKGRYRGVTTNAPAIYWGQFLSGSETVGTYSYVRVEDDSGGDTVAYVADNGRDHLKLRQNTRHLHSTSGDEFADTLSEV